MTKKAILNRAFTPREKGLILALALVLVGAFYYFAVIQGTSATLSANEQRMAELQVSLEEQQLKAVQLRAMEAELEQLSNKKEAPQVQAYNNFRGEWDQLKGLLRDATSFQLNFGDPVATGQLVRRPVQASFTTGSYQEALALVERIQKGQYRCVINDFGMSQVSDQVKDQTGVSVSVSMTFYETLEGATDLSGLTFADQKDQG